MVLAILCFGWRLVPSDRKRLAGTFWATRAAFIFGLGRTFKLNGIMVGSDKFGHFFSQGHKYYRRELRGEREDLLLAKGAFAERWVFGQLTTGIFSNADLVKPIFVTFLS